MEELTYNKFCKKYKKPNKKWKFNLFVISCKKCGSKRVEFNSDMELEQGYYDTYSVWAVVPAIILFPVLLVYWLGVGIIWMQITVNTLFDKIAEEFD